MKVYRSNRADVLARELANVLRTPAGDPLAPERVVVSGRAAERWVAAHVAQVVGIAANVRALSPSTFVAETLAAVREAPDDAAGAWEVGRLTWAVLRLLPSLAAEPAFASVRFYLGAEPAFGSARAVGLARRIAEAFERYVTSRPEMVLAWDAGEDDDAVRHGHAWQPRLWRELGGILGAAHPAAVARDAVRQIQTGRVPAARLPRRVTWLTHGSIARLHLEVLEALAARDVEVHLFVLSPSRGAARAARALAPTLVPQGTHPLAPGPLPLGHALIESLGRQSRDFERLLAAGAARAGGDVDLYVEPAGDGALATLQRDLLDCTTRGEGGAARLPFPDGDDSIRVHACHGALRQVEVLRDELLRCFDEMPGLEPRDVVVLAPALERFAPLVEAVFAAPVPAGDGAPPRLPFRIADRPVRRENAAADAVLRYLALIGGRFDATAVLDLLATPAVARRFRLDGIDRDTLCRWVSEGGIRWGIDAEHRKEHQVPPASENCWRFGLDRLLIGQAMAGEGRELFEGVLPYDEIEGREAERLGLFVDACERLFGRSRELSRARPMRAWREALAAVAAELLDEGDDALAWSLHGFRAALDALADDADAAGHHEAMDLAAVRLLLEARFGEPGAAGGFGSGAVTVCALLPGRTVPARVVALLGLDDGDFPRQRGGAGFDLVAREPRLGDADPNVDDRQRFLEAVMGAGERLVVTHTGRSTSTNEAVPPAVPVGELLDALDATFSVPDGADGTRGSCRTRVVRAHPLQPFAPASFRAPAGGEPSSYDRTWLAAAERLLTPRPPARPFVARALQPPPSPPVRPDGELTVTVAELGHFFASPAKALLAGRLRLSLGARDAALPTREPSELDALQAYGIRRELLERALAGEDVGRALTSVRASGRLPHGAVGELEFEALLEDVRRLREEWNLAWTTEPRDPVEVDFAADGVRLVGTIGPLQEGGLLRCQPGKARDDHLVDLWVHHLALAVALRGEAALTSVLVAMPDGRAARYATRLGPVEDPAAVLAPLLRLYAAGQRTPLPFFPATSRAFAKAMRKHAGAPDAAALALTAARARWAPAGGNGFGAYDSDDPYVRRAFGTTEPFGDASCPDSPFQVAALAVWQPLERAMESA